MNRKRTSSRIAHLLFFSSEYVMSSRLSISSMLSVDSSRSSIQLPHQIQETVATDANDSISSDQASLGNSLPIFAPTEAEDANGNHDLEENEEATASIVSTKKPAKERTSLFKQKTLTSASTIFDSFDTDLTRAYQRLEATLAKSLLEPKRMETMTNSIDSQLADMRLMIDCEKNCSLLESRTRSAHGLANDRQFQSMLSECDTYLMKLLFEQYLNANAILANESSKNKSVSFSFGKLSLSGDDWSI